MGKSPKFPVRVREGAVVVSIYRNRAASTLGGWVFVVAWVGAEGRVRQSFAEFGEAREFAGTKAAFLADGIIQGTLAKRGDFVELAELRHLALQGNTPALQAMGVWLQAWRLVGDQVLEACRAWAARVAEGELKRVAVVGAIDAFIGEKTRSKKQGERVYRSKLKYAGDHFGEIFLDTVSVVGWTVFLEQFADAVTRNDVRKRCITLCRWARRRGHLPRLLVPAVEETERAKERAVPIGIISPGTLRELLVLFCWPHLERLLGGLVLANFAGLRVEEIHGKREDVARRQRWEDIHLERGFLSVSAAKENTPSNRVVHLGAAAVAWLRLCPDAEGRVWPEQKGAVCAVNGVTRIRDIARGHGFVLPKNCFRHAWISHRIARTGDKGGTATEAGNSVKEIDRRYRVPLPKFLGEEWEGVMPTSIGSMLPRPGGRSG